MKKLVTLFIIFNFLALPIMAQNVYKPYNKPLKNQIMDTQKYSEKGIDFTVNKMEMITKIHRFVYGYEIIIENNTDNDILLQEVVTEDFMNLFDIANKLKQSFKIKGLFAYVLLTVSSD